MSFDDASVVANERGDGNGLRRRDRKIERSRGLAPHCETFAGLGITIFAQSDELLLHNHATQSKDCSTNTEPFTAHSRALGVVITDAQMLIEVAPCVHEIGLSFRRKHRALSPRDDVPLRRSERRADAETCENVALMRT